MIYSVVLIGLGRIGYEYDISNPTYNTHFSAISNNKNFRIICAIDNDEIKRKNFSKQTGIKTYKMDKFLKTKNTFDLLVIATPTETHLDVFKKIKNFKSKIVLCEKPLSDNLQDTKEIINICKNSNFILLTNFFRRYEKSAIEIKRHINLNQKFKVVVFYSNGIYNNGSHFLDLVDLWFGKPQSFLVLKKIKSYKLNDYDVDFVLKFKNGEITFLCWDEKFYSNYFIKIFTEKNRIDYDFNGFETKIYNIIENEDFKGFKKVNTEYIKLENNLKDGFKNIYEYIFNILTNKKTTKISMNTPELIEKILFENEK